MSSVLQQEQEEGIQIPRNNKQTNKETSSVGQQEGGREGGSEGSAISLPFVSLQSWLLPGSDDNGYHLFFSPISSICFMLLTPSKNHIKQI